MLENVIPFINYFYGKTKLLADFQIYISVPLKPETYLEPSRLRKLRIYVTLFIIFLKMLHRRCASGF